MRLFASRSFAAGNAAGLRALCLDVRRGVLPAAVLCRAGQRSARGRTAPAALDRDPVRVRTASAARWSTGRRANADCCGTGAPGHRFCLDRHDRDAGSLLHPARGCRWSSQAPASSMAMPAAQNAVLGAVAPAEIGKAAGTFNMLRYLGGAFGIALLVRRVHGERRLRLAGSVQRRLCVVDRRRRRALVSRRARRTGPARPQRQRRAGAGQGLNHKPEEIADESDPRSIHGAQRFRRREQEQHRCGHARVACIGKQRRAIRRLSA